MNIALLLSGGTGDRLPADVPKQYIRVNGKMIVTRCLERLRAHPMLDAVRIVAAEDWRDRIREEAGDEHLRFSAPGRNRQESTCHALRDLLAAGAGPDDVVLVHDAVRPLVSGALISACLHAIEGHDGVMPVLPMTDTVYWSGDGRRVDRLLRRDAVYAGQAPEAFRLGKYWEANQALLPDRILRINGSTEPAILAGMDIVMIPGERENFKITTREDLARYRAVLAGGKGRE